MADVVLVTPLNCCVIQFPCSVCVTRLIMQRQIKGDCEGLVKQPGMEGQNNDIDKTVTGRQPPRKLSLK